MRTGIWKSVSEFIKIIDPSSWPAFFMFLVVLAAAGGLNYVGMSPIVGGGVAFAIALFFGVGVLSWHIVEARTDDSEEQEDIAQIVKWINVILDGLLIVLNLFRADLRAAPIPNIEGLSVWDGSAFVVIGLSAASHVVGYLLWTQESPRRKNQKEKERGLNDVALRKQRSEIAIAKTRKHLDALKWIQEQEMEIRATYKDHIPPQQIEALVKDMKQNALKEFEGLTAEAISVDQNARSNPPPNSPPKSQDATHEEKRVPVPHRNGQQPQIREYTLAELLNSIGKTQAQFRDFLIETETYSKAWQVLRDEGRLPAGIVKRNFYALAEQVYQPNPT